MNKKDSPGFIVIMFIIFTFVGLGIFYIFTDYNSPFIDETNIYATKIYHKKDDNSLTYSSVFLKSNNKSIYLYLKEKHMKCLIIIIYF